MDPDHVAAHVRERSGLDVQAVTLVRAGPREEAGPRVWAAMTELGYFWAVENGASIELFRAVARRTAPDDMLSCHSAIEAARRFLLLHPVPNVPREEPAERDEQPAPPTSRAECCQTCGATFVRRRQVGAARPLCPRCRHAERERLRYQQDPRYRARRLAYSAARYRQGQEAGRASE